MTPRSIRRVFLSRYDPPTLKDPTTLKTTPSIAWRARRDRAARGKHPVLVVLFVAHERRGKHAQKMNVGMGAHAVPILGSHVVGHAGSELPSLASGDIGHLAGARNDVVRLPVVLVPEDGFGTRRKAYVREPEADTVGFGQHADRARLAVGRNHLLPGPTHLVYTFDEHSPIGLLDATAGLVGTVFVEAFISLERWAEDADVTLVLR